MRLAKQGCYRPLLHQGNHFLFSYGNTRFKITPANAHNAVPDNVTGPNSKIAPPKPSTNIELAIIKLLAFQLTPSNHYLQ